VQATLAQITWYHNITLLQKVPHKEKRLWHIRKTMEQGGNREYELKTIDIPSILST
jgi:hypothetical protein